MKCLNPKILSFLLFLSFASLPRAQGVEVEPNQPCSSAQSAGQVLLPFTMGGSLDPPAGQGDVDFYRFEQLPSSGLRIDLEGQATGRGTLGDPFVGVFDSSCNLIVLDDDGGSGASSRVLVSVPADGVVVLAATSCCDHQFEGNVGVSGSYELTISAQGLASSISGRAVDGVTGEPLSGNDFPFAFAELFQCNRDGCSEPVGSRNLDSEGRFRFDESWLGTPLLSGTYLIAISAETYVDARTDPFDVAVAEDLDLPDTPVTPVPRATGVRGRIVDSVSWIPLAGDTSPFARVELWRCDDFGCFEFVGSQETNDQGRFLFERSFGRPLLAGTYQLRVEAREYERTETRPFSVTANELKRLGNILLKPFPVRITEVSTCGDLPSAGGLCLFRVRFTNRLDVPVEGAAWSVVKAFGTGSLAGESVFQLGSPRRIALPPGSDRVAFFGFSVPGSVEDGASSCVEVFVGLGSTTSLFNTVGHRELFCIQKHDTGGLTVLSEKESHRVLAEIRKGTRPINKRR